MSLNNNRFAEQNDIVLTGQVQTSNNNQTTLNAVLAETNQLRGTSVIFQSTGLLATTSNPIPNVTATTQGTIGAALGGIGQAGTASTDPGGGGGGNPPCFVADTWVLMADNTEKRICDISLGEYVKAFDNHGNFVTSRVIGLHQSIAKEALKIDFADGQSTGVTANHPYWVVDEVFTPISQLSQVWHWDDVWMVRKIVRQTPIVGEVIVYNLEIETHQTYVANGDAVHNLCPLPPDNFESQ